MADKQWDAQCVIFSQDKVLISELLQCSLSVSVVSTAAELLARAKLKTTEMLVVDGTGTRREDLAEQIYALHDASPQVFICVYGDAIGRNAQARIDIADCGGAMTTWSVSAVKEAAEKVQSTLQHAVGSPTFCCPYCKKPDLSEDGLWLHCPMYHLNERNINTTCPICLVVPRHFIQVHIRNHHGPVRRGELASEFYDDVSVDAYGIVVCRRQDGKFLLVQEFCNAGYWMPGGRLNPGEGLCEGAKREALEEAGVDVKLTGVLQLEYIPTRSHGDIYVEVRCIFMAEPVDPDQELKSVPDFESVGAAWVSAEELQAGLRLRCPEVRHWVKYVSEGKPVYPLSVLQSA